MLRCSRCYNVTVKKSVVILEDDSLRLAEMRKCLAELLPRFQHLYFDDAFKMIAWLEDHLAEVVLISLDHDLPTDTDHGTGRLVADYLAEKPPICPVIERILVAWNDAGLV